MKTTEQKVMAVLSYLGILVLVPILASKDAFVRYHANQGLVLFIADIIAGVVGGILSIIPLVGGIVSSLIGLAVFILIIIGIVNACKGEEKPLPIIGGITIIK